MAVVVPGHGRSQQKRVFIDAVLARLGRDPDDGGILGPDQRRRLRSLIFGWEALDRFRG